MQNTFTVSTDKSQLDIPMIHHYLSKESYWAMNIPLNLVMKSIEGSFCFGVYEEVKQVGFARVITDLATYAYLADVFIIPSSQGKGLGKMLMKAIMEHPDMQGFRRWMLATRDAHGLYAQFGFTPLEKPERIMALSPFLEYPDEENKKKS